MPRDSLQSDGSAAPSADTALLGGVARPRRASPIAVLLSVSGLLLGACGAATSLDSGDRFGDASGGADGSGAAASSGGRASGGKGSMAVGGSAGAEVLCRYAGGTYSPGEGFPATDGCNKCSCQADGSVSCTQQPCTPVTRCEYEKVLYSPGDLFLSSDGCSRCTCQGNGSVNCELVSKSCSTPCDYNGTTYAAGATFNAGDGCNTCTCRQGGEVACSFSLCGCEYEGILYPFNSRFTDGCDRECSCDDAGNVACQQTRCACRFQGRDFLVGASFIANDDCSSCVCLGDGSVACNDLACGCNPDRENWRFYSARLPSSCPLIDSACPGTTTAFSNECGCGCEQPRDCPDSISCKTGCDAALLERCPYSALIPL